MSDRQSQQYPWDGPEDDVIAEEGDELSEGPRATMLASNDRTNFVRTQNREYNHTMFTDEPPDLGHSFKKGGRGEAPSAFDYLIAAGMGCQVNTLEQMLHKARIEDYEIEAECTGFTVLRDNVKRIQKLELAITLRVPEAKESQGSRCLDVYEQGCVVGETLKRGMDFQVEKELELDDSVA
ncbi:OsmC family protein [Halomicroarcula sp. GCM10025324]|uniref:OsmC family protein n=1 Tax=Haloarcula TaxID=2237 RepID=UPI0023E76BE4|nr:OsmC family protein [Halomicroarcula sp. ZS-22-S1]